MDRRRVKFVLLGAGIVGTMAFLLAIGINQSGAMHYYMTVSEFVAHGATADDGVRINGKVVNGSIQRLPGGEDVRFAMSDGQATLEVAYHGIVPDTFVERADVVVGGSLQDNGTFSAHELLAKCPSKYEAADDAESPAPAAE